jgi:hypothetical protein
MARSRRKAGGATTGRFKPKKMGKGYSTNRKTPIGSRPVLRITEPVAPKADTSESAKSEG